MISLVLSRIRQNPLRDYELKKKKEKGIRMVIYQFDRQMRSHFTFWDLAGFDNSS